MRAAPLLRAAWLALLLGGCAGPQLYHPQLSSLDKGLSAADVMQRLKLAPRSVHSAVANGRPFEFHRFQLNNGIQSDLYLLAYEGDRLVFWGYISEFRRHPDRDMNAALDTAMRQIAAAAR